MSIPESAWLQYVQTASCRSYIWPRSIEQVTIPAILHIFKIQAKLSWTPKGRVIVAHGLMFWSDPPSKVCGLTSVHMCSRAQ